MEEDQSSFILEFSKHYCALHLGEGSASLSLSLSLPRRSNPGARAQRSGLQLPACPRGGAGRGRGLQLPQQAGGTEWSRRCRAPGCGAVGAAAWEEDGRAGEGGRHVGARPAWTAVPGPAPEAAAQPGRGARPGEAAASGGSSAGPRRQQRHPAEEHQAPGGGSAHWLGPARRPGCGGLPEVRMCGSGVRGSGVGVPRPDPGRPRLMGTCHLWAALTVGRCKAGEAADA